MNSSKYQQSKSHFFSELLDLCPELLAVARVLPLGRFFTLHHLFIIYYLFINLFIGYNYIYTATWPFFHSPQPFHYYKACFLTVLLKSQYQMKKKRNCSANKELVSHALVALVGFNMFFILVLKHNLKIHIL